MLPDHYFNPLNISAVVDDAYDESRDEAAAREMIRETLLDPRSQGDPRVFDLVWECLEFYDDDELPAAVTLLDQVIVAHPDQRFALGALRAACREPAGVEEVEALHRDLMLLLPERRDVRFYYLAPGVLADGGHPERGAALAKEGAALATSLGLEEAADQIIQRSPAPEHQELASQRLQERLKELEEAVRRERVSATPQGRRAFTEGSVAYRMVYLPEQEYAKAMAEGLLDATFPLDHEDHRREVEVSLLNTAEMGRVSVLPIDVAGLLAFAEGTGKDPARRSTRLAYVVDVDAKLAISWPPERNAPCWCGSDRKYKKCCGRPGFRDEPLPDRARAVLMIELPGAEPPAWRRVTVPFRIRLDRLHDVIVEAMGLEGGEVYAFEIEGAEVVDPRVDVDAARTDETHLPELANEPGQSFVHRYGFGEEREHRVTVEEFVAVDPADNHPQVLDGAET